MDSEKYVVELEFKRLGDFGIEQINAKLKKAEGGVQAFKKGWSEFSSSISPVGDMFDGIAAKVGNIAKVGAVMAGGALLAGATYGVVNLNNELEKAEISVGTIFSANGLAANVPAGIERAKGLIAEMRVDAQKLPGEFEDLMNIFTTAAIPAFKSGASIEQFRGLSAEAMAAGKVMQLDMHMAAREFGQLLSGRAGSHNVFGTRLGLTGDEAHKFNAMAADKRLEVLSTELHKYSGAIDAFGNTFDAQSSTLVDNLKNFGRDATAPLFETVKETMGEVNAWFTTHKDEVHAFASEFGYELRDGFVTVKNLAQEYGPILLNFAETASLRFHALVYEGEKLAESWGITGESFRQALEDPNGTIDKLIRAGEIWLALKVAQGSVGAVTGVVNAASGIGGMMKGLGLLGSAAPALAEGGAAAPSTLAIAGAGAAFIAAVGGITAAAYEWKGLQDDIHDDYTKTANAKAEASMREIQQMVQEGYSEEMIQQRINAMHDKYIASGENMAANILDVALAAAQAAGELRSIAQTSMEGRGRGGPYGNDDWSKPLAYGFDPMSFNTKYQAVAEKERNPDANAHKSKGGHGGTVQKVEIVITSNQNPNRIARAVSGELSKAARMRGSSPHVTNYSALENG